MEAIGSQVKLPLSKAYSIAVQGIRIRIGRSLVTVSGVVLGMAFLMSNITGQLIKKAIVREQETRQTANLMYSLVTAEIGTVQDKTIAVAAMGPLSSAEAQLVRKIMAQAPAQCNGFGFQEKGVKLMPLDRIGQDAVILLILGDERRLPLSMGALAAGMRRKVVLDSLAERVSPPPFDPAVRRELFFGAQLDQYKSKMLKDEAQAKTRTVWIVIISMLVTVIGVSNALLMSVTERFREIGTMKCLGALSSFIRMLFLVESSLIGMAGSIAGVLLGAMLSIVAYGSTYGFSFVYGSIQFGWLIFAGFVAVLVGTLLAVVAALYPATFASRMVPASALRSTV